MSCRLLAASLRQFGTVAALLLFGLGSAYAMEMSVAATVVQAGEVFIVDVTAEAPVSLRTAWNVLTDFEHMTTIVGNLNVSKVIHRAGNVLVVRQEGTASFGALSLPFESEREIQLEPMKRIKAKSISGSVKRMESELRLGAAEDGVRIDYRAEVVPDSMLARLFGASFLRHEVDEQFRSMTKEILRREGRPTP